MDEIIPPHVQGRLNPLNTIAKIYISNTTSKKIETIIALIFVFGHNKAKTREASIVGISQPSTGAIDLIIGTGARII